VYGGQKKTYASNGSNASYLILKSRSPEWFLKKK
jgi:hypothetical protein